MGSISGSVKLDVRVDGKVLGNLGRNVSELEHLIKGEKKGPARRLIEEREQRADAIIDKFKRGEVLNSAMDALQMFSAGGIASDAASALGVVNSETDKMVLSAIVNAVTFNVGAAAGDLEDAMKSGLPKLRASAMRFEEMGQVPRAPRRRCAASHEASSPQAQFKKGHARRGYARSPRARGEVDLRALLGGGEFSATLKGRLEFPGFSGPFARDLPRMLGSFDARFGDLIDQVAKPPRSGQAEGADATEEGGSEYEKIFNDPSLSFEDKLFLFMALVAKKQEEKVEKAMKKYDEFQKRQKDKEKKDKAMGMASGLASLGVGAALTAAGIPPPLSMMLGSMITSAATDGLKEVDEGLQGVRDEAKTEDDDTKLSKDEKNWSEQRWMMELQRLQEMMSKMYQMLSNTMKSMNDTQMTAVRNLR